MVMAILDVRDQIEAFVTSASVLGGAMAYASGSAALTALILGEQATVASARVTHALGRGFAVGLPLATIVFIVLSI